MIKKFSLQPLMNLAQHQKDSATHRLGQLNRQQESAQQKLDTLLEYRRDYQSRLHEASQHGMEKAELRNFHQFINKLDEAISQQARLVENSRISTQAGCCEFNKAQRKLKSFDMLQQRHVEEQKKAEIKSEQKALDEHTSRSAAQRIMNPENQNNMP